MYVCKCACNIYECKFVRMSIYASMYVCIYVGMFVCKYILVYVFVHAFKYVRIYEKTAIETLRIDKYMRVYVFFFTSVNFI